MVTKEDRWGGGMDWGVGWAYAHYCIWNGWSAGTCCRTQGTQTQYSVIIYTGEESKKRMEIHTHTHTHTYIHTYNWIALLHNRNYHIINQLYFNIIFKSEKILCLNSNGGGRTEWMVMAQFYSKLNYYSVEWLMEIELDKKNPRSQLTIFSKGPSMNVMHVNTSKIYFLNPTGKT